MLKPMNIIGCIIISISAFGLFQVKFYVQNLRNDLTELNRQIEKEKENIHVLKAEWAYLNQPDRLRKIIEKHLQLEPIKVTQIQKLQNDLPILLSEADNFDDEKILSNFAEKSDHLPVKHKNSSNKVKLVKGKINKNYKSKISVIKF